VCGPQLERQHQLFLCGSGTVGGQRLEGRLDLPSVNIELCQRQPRLVEQQWRWAGMQRARAHIPQTFSVFQLLQ
jgi:hypothetical protein